MEIFVSYSHQDRDWLDRKNWYNIGPWLRDCLAPHGVTVWWDESITAGERWNAVIEQHIDSADVAVLLVTQQFISSQFILENELPRIAAREEAGAMHVVPVLLEDCLWEHVWALSRWQMTPGGPTPLEATIDPDRPAKFTAARKEILAALMRRVQKPPQPTAATSPQTTSLPVPTPASPADDAPAAEAPPRLPKRPRPLRPRDWTILDEMLAQSAASLLDLAMGIVLEGPRPALRGIPTERFGHLLVFEREDIESHRLLQSLLRDYYEGRASSPFGVAVFGPVGTGKLFGVSQVAKSVTGPQLTHHGFDLSQFSGPEQVAAALAQVQRSSAGGPAPLVSWDGFDQPLQGRLFGWLRHFIPILRDGAYSDADGTYQLGPMVFIFTAKHYDSVFEFDLGDDDAFAAAQGPEFLALLKYTLDLKGANPDGDAGADPHFVLRRALLLRSLLERSVPQIFSEEKGRGDARIDRGVLQAFLGVGKYRLGARSMEAILGMCQLTGARSLGWSNLPSEAQLALHVNAREFMALEGALLLEADSTDPRIRALVEDLAVLIHQVYCEGLLEQVGGDPSKVDDIVLRPFSELPPDLQAQSTGQVIDIPRRLRQAGCVIVPGRAGGGAFYVDEGLCETLAKLEHGLWIRQKAAQGFRYGPERNHDRARGPLTNPSMLPWDAMTEDELEAVYPDTWELMGTHALPEHEKVKDRAFMRYLPRILAVHGYVIVRLPAYE